jgi:hypothetical protein
LSARSPSEELGVRLKELESARATAARELEALRSAWERVEQMERDRDAILEAQAAMAPGALEALTPEERRQFYKMGGLQVVGGEDGRIEETGPLVASPEVCNSGSAPSRR